MLMLKNTILFILSSLYYCSGYIDRFHNGKVVILMYHRVLDDDDPAIKYIQPGMYVTRSSFDMQMGFINKYYEVISLDELLELSVNESFKHDKQYCVITFDDGWLDNYKNAYPVLQRYKMPAAIFIVTNYIETDKWFWPDLISYIFLNNDISADDVVNLRLSNEEFSDVVSFMKDLYRTNKVIDYYFCDKLIVYLKKYTDDLIYKFINDLSFNYGLDLPKNRTLLNWDEINEMAKNKIIVGSHTSTHKILTNISLLSTCNELVGSLAAIQEKAKKITSVFCYPNGNYNNEIKEAVYKSGYRGLAEYVRK